MPRYLVTGGCGFIGSHLADSLLSAGHEVRILDDLSSGRPENKPAGAELVEGDVADGPLVAQALRDCDACFHLAAIASVERGNRDWVGTHRTNLTGSIVVFDAARGAKSTGPVPVVYASSAAVYGDSTDLPLSENAIVRPLSAYGADKLGCELHGFVAGRVHGVPTCGLRFFNVYGPRQDPASPYSGVVSIFCNRLRQRQGVTIFGDGEQTRDFIYVGDVVRALRSAMARASIDAPVYNVCTGIAASVRDLVEAIGAVLGHPPDVSFRPGRSGDVRHSRGDPGKAERELGFRAETDLRVGLASVLNETG